MWVCMCGCNCISEEGCVCEAALIATAVCVCMCVRVCMGVEVRRCECDSLVPRPSLISGSSDVDVTFELIKLGRGDPGLHNSVVARRLINVGMSNCINCLRTILQSCVCAVLPRVCRYS